MSLLASACGNDSEPTRTTNSLSDAGVDASVDAEAGSEQTDASSSSSSSTSRATQTDSSVQLTSSASNEAHSTVQPDAGASPQTSEPPEETTAVTSEPPDAGEEPNSTEVDAGANSEPPLPATCRNGAVDGDEMCCRQSDVDSALKARIAAAELILNGDLGCAPTNSGEQQNVVFETCGGSCGTDTGCKVSASNVKLTYDPTTKRLNGTADVLVQGSVVLQLTALNQSVSCDTADILFEEVTFAGDLNTEVEQEQATINVRNLESDVGLPAVSGCPQGGNIIAAAFLLMQGPIEEAVNASIEDALEGTIAQPIECPY